MEPQDPQASERSQGKKKVHSLIDKVYRRQNLARAWEQGQKNRGSAGLDEVRMAPCETRTADDLARLHRQRRDGTYQPPPVTRVESPKSAGGVRKLGIPAGLDGVGQQALVQRMEASFEPKVLDSSLGDRQGRWPHDAMRQVWQALNAGNGGIVDAALRPFFDTIDQEKRLDVIAEEISEGRVLQLMRDSLRSGVMAGGSWQPTPTGVPQGGVARPLGSNIFLTPFDWMMAAEGFRRTRWAEDVVVRWQTREEAQRVLARAKRFLREARGVELHPQKTRIGQVRHGVACRGSKGKQGPGHRLPASKRRRRANLQNL